MAWGDMRRGRLERRTRWSSALTQPPLPSKTTGQGIMVGGNGSARGPGTASLTPAHLLDIHQFCLIDLSDGDVVLGCDGKSALGEGGERSKGMPPEMYSIASLTPPSLASLGSHLGKGSDHTRQGDDSSLITD